eukprot:2463824-Amphidinium_carterae.2
MFLLLFDFLQEDTFSNYPPVSNCWQLFTIVAKGWSAVWLLAWSDLGVDDGNANMFTPNVEQILLHAQTSISRSWPQ